jgi:hypothetical protein
MLVGHQKFVSSLTLNTEIAISQRSFCLPGSSTWWFVCI